ncbi:MAG: hypothetical protein M8353_08805, partial [ANME-2 cluster archaeon]|nr:hypothetical protein [ANME-2 cluster archaeon]
MGRIQKGNTNQVCWINDLNPAQCTNIGEDCVRFPLKLNTKHASSNLSWDDASHELCWNASSHYEKITFTALVDLGFHVFLLNSAAPRSGGKPAF